MPEALYFTDSDEANELIASDPLALLIGFAIDQQVTVQQAFQGPLRLKQRIGTLDAAEIAAMDPEKLEDAFRERPAIHRFPRAMAARVQELCAVVAEEYGGQAERIWTEAADAADLRKRIGSLPGFGKMKITGLGPCSPSASESRWLRSSCPITRASAESTRRKRSPTTRPRSAPIGRLSGS